ncbi:unnamed protein product [Plutella xylostella]|uniref:(diamondback moth) hypothetical protein n=1 Tax=Plutella xylostella TaxID=51655 RepID=A0A8S4GB98_PLUXY|nr:unnamed protein product [Plutella xylostella]
MDSRVTSEVWNHFKKIGQDKAQCNHCPKSLSCKGSSTSGLSRHLELLHNIKLNDHGREASSAATTSASSPTPGTSTGLPQTAKKRKVLMVQTSMDQHIKPPSTIAEIVSNLAAKDGLSVRQITNSEVIRGFVSQAGLNMPKCETSVMRIITDYAEEKKQEIITSLNKHVKNDDVLYCEKTSETESEESVSDLYDSYEDFAQSENRNRDIRPDLNKVLKETRIIVNLFRRSPLKNAKLQEYVKLEHNTEKTLCRDVKTRWNSIETMISRFIEVKNCIKKALIDINYGHLWHEENLAVLEDLVKIMNPIKLAVEALSSQKANITVCEAVITALIGRLSKMNTPLAVEFSDHLIRRISERRDPALYTLTLFLQNPIIQGNEYITESSVTKESMIQYADKLFRRLFPQQTDSESSPEETLQVIAQRNRETSFAVQLQEAIENAFKGCPPPRIGVVMLKKDFDMYSASGKRTPNLEMLHNALQSIMSTSTEAERTFSVSGNFATKIRKVQILNIKKMIQFVFASNLPPTVFL